MFCAHACTFYGLACKLKLRTARTICGLALCATPSASSPSPSSSCGVADSRSVRVAECCRFALWATQDRLVIIVFVVEELCAACSQVRTQRVFAGKDHRGAIVVAVAACFNQK
jgi:hypothetical protein